MNYEQHVRRASGGDVKAFVDLTRQFQHMAFGAAFALVNDFHQACAAQKELFGLRPRPGIAGRPPLHVLNQLQEVHASRRGRG
jgi:hypothetical protein